MTEPLVTLGRVDYVAVIHEGATAESIAEDIKKMYAQARIELVNRGFFPQDDTFESHLDWWNRVQTWSKPDGGLIRGIGLAKVVLMGTKEE